MTSEHWTGLAHAISIVAAFIGFLIARRYQGTATDRSRLDSLQNAHVLYVALLMIAVVNSAVFRVFFNSDADIEQYRRSPITWAHAALIFTLLIVESQALGRIKKVNDEMAESAAVPPDLVRWLHRLDAIQLALFPVLAISAVLFVRVGQQ